jgi:hypothetical protein
VKVSTSQPQLSNLLLRQTPGYSGRWGECQFVVNEPVDQCDWWFVCHHSALQEIQSCICDPAHVVYISMEPKDVYPIDFYRQFSKLILCDPMVNHASIHYRNGITWWAGINVAFSNGHQFSSKVNHDYDAFMAMPPPVHKLDRVSIITSTKDIFPGHRRRLAFIERLKQSDLADRIDFYGGGHNPVDDKLDAILPYKYHIALENSILDHYWTEKIADAYLGYALPLYHGCRNISSYFPSNSLVALDISSDQAIAQIKTALDADIYSQHLEMIKQARVKVLNDHNLFALMASIATVKARRLKPCLLRPSGSRMPLVRRALSKLKLRAQGLMP